jgi:DNA-binding MarR family transcriptional regulator
MSKYDYKSDTTPDEEILISVVRVSEKWKRNCSSIFKNFGLTYAQYNAIRVLRASENGTNTITNISKLMLVSGANMTGIAKRLEINGFLLRKSDPDDERKTILEITPKGIKTIKNISGHLEGLVDHLLQEIPSSKRKVLLGLLDTIFKFRDYEGA